MGAFTSASSSWLFTTQLRDFHMVSPQVAFPYLFMDFHCAIFISNTTPALEHCIKSLYANRNSQRWITIPLPIYFVTSAAPIIVYEVFLIVVGHVVRLSQ